MVIAELHVGRLDCEVVLDGRNLSAVIHVLFVLEELAVTEGNDGLDVLLDVGEGCLLVELGVRGGLLHRELRLQVGIAQEGNKAELQLGLAGVGLGDDGPQPLQLLLRRIEVAAEVVLPVVGAHVHATLLAALGVVADAVYKDQGSESSWNLTEPRGTSRKLTEPRGTSRNLAEPHGTSRNLTEPCEKDTLTLGVGGADVLECIELIVAGNAFFDPADEELGGVHVQFLVQMGLPEGRKALSVGAVKVDHCCLRCRRVGLTSLHLNYIYY